MKNFLLVFFLVALGGCASLSRNYLYSPSPFERAAERAIGADGKPAAVVLADIDVMRSVDQVEQSWRKRDQAARGIDLAEQSTQAGLGVVPVVMSVLNFAWPVGPIVSVLGGLISKIVGSINPVARVEAYADGISMLSDAKAEYFESAQGGQVPGDKLTQGGLALLKKRNYAIALVEKAIAGRVPTAAEVVGAASGGK